MTITLIGTSIAVAVFISAFIFLSYYEKDVCSWKIVTPYILLYMLAAVLLSVLQMKTECYLPGCALCGYISYSAWTDSRDKYIYALPFSVFLIMYIASLIVATGSLSYIVIWMLMMLIFYIFCCKLGKMGKGDMYVISGIFLMLTPYYALICISIAAVIFLVSNYLKEAKMNENQAFIPSLMIALIITMIFYK